MRPAITLACLLSAAAAGAVTARLSTPTPADPTPVRTLAAQTAELAAQAALPAAASAAATPAPIPGAPIPSLAPMLERVTPAVVNVTTKQVVRVSNPIADFFGGGPHPSRSASRSRWARA